MAADPPPFANYFELLQGFLQPFQQGSAPAAVPNFPILDPKELEKKIGEMETVLLWLKAQSGAVELTLETMKVQLAWLKEWQNQTRDAPTVTAEQQAKFAEAFHPANWAWSKMPQAATFAAPAPAKATKPRSAGRKKR